nr:hypothetical protein [Anaerolineae bacterium]
MTQHSYKDYADTRIYNPVLAYSPDGTKIAHVTNESGQFNLWVMDSGGGGKRQLTHYTDNTVRAVNWSPDGANIVFSADHDGDEQMQLYTLNLASGEITPLRHTPARQHLLRGYSPDGQWVAYAANDREPQDMDAQLINLQTGEHRRLNSGMFSVVADWSQDNRYVTVLELRSNTDSAIWLYDLETAEFKKLVESASREGAQHYAVGFSPDASKVYFLSDEGREFTGLGVYDITSGERSWVETPEADVENAAVTKSGLLVWVLNTDGASTLHARDLTTGQAVTMPTLPLGVVTG